MMSRVVLGLACAAVALAQNKVQWSGIPTPTGDLKHKVTYSQSYTIDGVKKDMKYHTLARSGDEFKDFGTGKSRIGMLTDINGQIINLQNDDGSKSDKPDISVNPDYVSFLERDGKLYSIAHFESPRPGTSYWMELSQDATTGLLSIVKTAPLDFSKLGGCWVPCAGSKTPWESHLGSEEYEPDARTFDADANKDKDISDRKIFGRSNSRSIPPFMRYFGMYTTKVTPTEARAKGFFPYMYGYIWETKINMGKESTAKHFTLGRRANELGYVMPDRKTTYMTDDGTDVMFNKFVATRENDLSTGELFCAKFIQTSPKEGAASGFDSTVKWISMGTASNADFEAKIKTTKFQDMFDVADVKNGTCSEGFKLSSHTYGVECLKIKPGMEILASRFETRRHASMLGCTTEFTKWEGITFDPVKGVGYTALAEIRSGMADKSGDIMVKANDCGCVMELTVDKKYDVTRMRSLICGKEIKEDASGNVCDLNGIASPDNVASVPEFNQLMIGEDTDGHVNDLIWMYDHSSGNITRIFTTPYGAETTGTYWYPNYGNGKHSYMTAVVQHPYGESDQDKVEDAASTGTAGWIGYFGPIVPVKVASSASSLSAVALMTIGFAMLATFFQ